ncbi:selenophosphate synthase [Sedimentibacter hydroxybenzoicus DSM 7310]|uniref:Selenophosphate synthase n=1 Tax=Sedimentibacter hydroxybenzoicus DSM 7310 TaxID=1123245 RepID=A0A974BL66_SEDHY|nr:selenophosphate synthase [Sedimentibacter hydroxybenzoicus]NYB75102.1 selenophosphate synthase [Sedimentibacter hydroxybenzoicus DSM 7310]
MDIKQIRDITVISFDENRYLGIACDSCGGIGLKEHDVVKVAPQVTAYHTGKVVLAELMSLGFKPMIMADGLAVEMNDTGKQLIDGFNEVLSKLKTTKVHLTGSTEENIKTVQTSMGVTCIGMCDKDKLKYKKTNKNDICLTIGMPLVGNEVINNPDKVLDIDDFEKLYLCDFIKEILPVGSRGIKAELNDLCNYNEIAINLNEDINIDLKKSGGPSCSALVTIEEKHIDIIRTLVNKPVESMGRFY